MNRNFSPTSTSAYPHLQSPSPSDMDPADSRHSDPSSKVNSKLQDESSSHSPETPDNTTEYPASPPAEGASSQTSRNGQDESTAEADPFKIATLDQFDKSPANPLKRRSQSPAPGNSSATPRRPPPNSFNTLSMSAPARSAPGRNALPKRPARMPYTAEQDDFIRFVRDDLSHSWETSALLYNQYWHPTGDGKREIPGLQSRYYRLLDQPMRQKKNEKKGVSAGGGSRRKNEAKDSLGRPEEGILARTNRRYFWMEGIYTFEEREDMNRKRARHNNSRRPAPEISDETDDPEDEDDIEGDGEGEYEDDEELPDAPDQGSGGDDVSSHGLQQQQQPELEGQQQDSTTPSPPSADS